MHYLLSANDSSDGRFLIRVMKVRRKVAQCFQMLEELLTQNHIPTYVFFRNKSEMKTFSDEEKLKIIH